MATNYYWHDQGSGLWQDPGNWNDAPDGTGAFLFSFVGDEFFRWDGTGPGSANDCTLSSFNSIDCAGFNAQDNQSSGIQIYVQSSTTITCRAVDSDVSSGYVADLGDDYGFGPTFNIADGATIVMHPPDSPSGPATIRAGQFSGTFSTLTIRGQDAEVIVEQLTLNKGLLVNVPLIVEAENAYVTVSATLYTIGGLAIRDDSVAHTSTVHLVNAITVYDVRAASAIIDPQFTITSVTAGYVELYILTDGENVSVPLWVAEFTDGQGTLLLNITRDFDNIYPAPGPGFLIICSLDKINFENRHLAVLRLNGSMGIFVANGVSRFECNSTAGDWEFQVDRLQVDGGNNGTSETFVGYSGSANSYCRIQVNDVFITNQPNTKTRWGVGIKNFNATPIPFGQLSIAGIHEFFDTAWIGPFGPIHVVIDDTIGASQGEFSVRNGIPVDSLTFLGDARFLHFTDAGILTMAGKLTFGAGDITWGNPFLDANYRIDLALVPGGSASDVLDADSFTTMIRMSAFGARKFQICNPNAFPVVFGGPGSILIDVESVCGDVTSDGTDGGGNINITFEEAPVPVTPGSPRGKLGLGLSFWTMLPEEESSAPVLPANIVAPSITGTPEPGQTLSCSTGTWTDADSFTYEWYRDGSPTSEASSTLFVQEGWVGAEIFCRVTAHNGNGSTSADSNSVEILAPAPVNTVPPTASWTGAFEGVGDTVQSTTGSWTYATSFAYQWYRTPSTLIVGATNATYVTVNDDLVAGAVFCRVTATGPGGSAQADSNQLVVNPGPQNIVAPVASGTPEVDEVLSCTTGTWNHATSFTYQWRRNGVAIGGATSSLYLLVVADAGQTIDCLVTASGLGGTASQDSNDIAVTALDADVLAYFAAAEAAGATYLDNTKLALNNLVLALKAGTLWGKRRRINPMLADGGNVLAGVAVVLDDTVGAANVDTLNNYVAGDWDPQSGLQGNGVSAYMDTGWNATAEQMAGGYDSICYRGSTITSSTIYLFGARSGGGTTPHIELYHVAAGRNGVIHGGYASASQNADLTPGIWAGNRTGTGNTDIEIYLNGVSVTTEKANLYSAGSLGASLPIGCRRYVGVLSIFHPVGARLAGYMFFDALDAGERADLQAAWSTFNAVIGR
jgi:hypothetical protein